MTSPSLDSDASQLQCSACSLDSAHPLSFHRDIISYGEAQGLRTELKRLDANLQAPNVEIGRARSNQTEQQRLRQTLVEAIAPNRLLSPELVLKIFSWLHQMHKKGQEEDGPASELRLPFSTPQQPWQWSLRQICSTWRNAAIHYHPLWSNLVVVGPATDTASWRLIWNQERWKRILEFTSGIISSVGMVSINIQLHSVGSFHSQAAFKLAYKFLLCPVANRIRCLTIETDAMNLVHFCKLDLSDLSALESLTFADDSSYDNSPPYRNIAVLLHRSSRMADLSRSLKEVAITSYVWNSPLLLLAPSFGIPWAQITHCTIMNHTADNQWASYEVVELLRLCHSIEDLTVNIAYEVAMNNDDLEIVSLPHLRRLSVCLGDPYLPEYLLVPALTHIQLLRPYDPPTSQIISLLERSGCTLKSYKEDVHEATFAEEMDDRQRKPITQSHFDNFIEHLHDVETLDIITQLTSNDLRRIGSGELLPNVKLLGFCYVHPLQPVIEALLPRLVENIPPNSAYTGLEEVHVRCHSPEQLTTTGFPPRDGQDVVLQKDGTIFRFDYNTSYTYRPKKVARKG